MQYTKIVVAVKIEKKKKIRKLLIFFIFFFLKHRLRIHGTDAVLSSTRNLCFAPKKKKIGTPLHTPILLYKIVVQGGILFMDMFSRW